MESDTGDELVHESAILKETGLNVRVLIGDEESSAIAAVRRGSSERIFNNRDVIPHLQKCFAFAVAQNKGKSTDLAAMLRAIPDHVFDQHENCGQRYYQGSENDSNSQQILLKNPELHQVLSELFQKYANNSAVAASSQGNESLNNIMAHKAPKNRYYSQREFADYQWASSICTKNGGNGYLPHVAKKLGMSPVKYTKPFIKRQDEIKIRQAAAAKLSTTKSRQNILRRLQELRKNTEQREGVQYQPNCGIEID
ncbi:uncharacterized protein LOC112493919 [Cephus cinctus]|uniref:Uncharacterized protein LOC112493919 n=1 Tax=Cephus cinctus TaxID=211228 RepID=A0AAJ7VYU3_CEPCN|nr:uncharacterized protein LOC112493919 [Cephus cinctus]